MKKKRKSMVSPTGVARWPYISTRDYKYNNEGKYSLSLEVDPKEEEGHGLLHELRVVAQEKSGIGSHVPYRRDVDRKGCPTGLYLVKFSSKFMPPVFDIHGDPLDDANIGTGTRLRVSFSLNLYGPCTLAPNGGLNLYLQAVQVFDLVEYRNGAEGFGFQVEEENEAPVFSIPEGEITA